MTLSLHGVERSVAGERHLHPTDLAFEDGTLTVLLGPVRAGKTSLLRLLAGLDRPSAGRIMQDGQDITRQDVRKRSVSMVYQQFINYPNFSVYENIASPLKVAGRLDAAQRDARVRDMARRLGLDRLLDRLPAELSGGQQQRTALARALAKDTKLLLLDEPLVNLDYKLREDLRAEMKALFRAGERAVVYATTEPQEALLLGGRTCVLREGRVEQVGPALEVFRAPASLDAARLISDPPMNFLPGAILPDTMADGARTIRLDGGESFAAPAGFAGLPNGRYTFGLHAAHLALAEAPGDIALSVGIELAEISGSETLLHGRHGEQPLLLQMPGVETVHIGARLRFHFLRERLYAFGADGRLAHAPSRNPNATRGAHGAHPAA